MIYNRVTNRVETIGFMGVHNSFSEKASMKFIETQHLNAETTPALMPLVDAFHVRDALLKGEIQLGVVAVRNSITGMVAETAEAFNGMDVEILAEYALPIHQCLFKLPGVPSDQLRHVASHPQALMQTRNNRRKGFGNMIEMIMKDTSLSAKMLADGSLSSDTAVVCSKEAGLMNGLELIGENIEDRSDNKTFFRLIRLAKKELKVA